MNVSVIVATHGHTRWKWLARRRALPSVAAQTLPPFEVIDWHSVDSTLAAARNQAASRARGEWLCFLDADDELEPGYLQAMVAGYHRWLADHPALREGEITELLVPAVQYVHAPEHEGATGYITTPEIPAWGQSLIEINCAVIGTLVPRWLFQHVGGFEAWPIYEDWDLWCRCVLAGARLVPVPEAVYVAHVRDDSRNRNQEEADRTYHAIRARHLPHYTPGMERSTP